MLIGWKFTLYPIGMTEHAFLLLYYIGNQFIIAEGILGGLWYMANVPWLRALPRHSVLRHTQ